MRVNIYSEELTNQIQVLRKEAEGTKYVGFRLFLHLPVTVNHEQVKDGVKPANVFGPFLHRPGDDDSSAVTFWVEENKLDDLHHIFSDLTHAVFKEAVARDEEIKFPPSGPDNQVDL